MEQYKVTIVGDVMCEPRLLQQAKRENGYDYKPTFANLKKLFSEADYVIANLETPLAGEEAGYTSRIVSFNAPDQFAADLKEAGVDLVSTANNHTTDRGNEGVMRTIRVLDELGLQHTGSYIDPNETERTFYFNLGSTRIAVIACTYGTNDNTDVPERTNLLRPQGSSGISPVDPNVKSARLYVESLLGRKLIWEESKQLQMAMGIPPVNRDRQCNPEEELEHIQWLREEYARARANADQVWLLPHMGGQFNEEPAAYSEFMMQQFMDMGFDAVLAAHSHTTQKAMAMPGRAFFYSLGNLTMTPCTWYSYHECLPEYGLAVHLYLEDGKIAKTTFSILKIIDNEETPQLTVVPVDELVETLDAEGRAQLMKEAGAVYARVTGKPAYNFRFRREFALKPL